MTSKGLDSMPKLIHQPHDKLFKQSMADIRVAKNFFETNLPSHMSNEIKLETLKLNKHTFIDSTFQTTEADVLYTVNTNKGLAYLYLLCEHQTEIDDQIAFRLLVYTARIMDMHLKQNPKSPLPIVYPMVIYTGEKEWESSKDIFDLFQENADLARQILL